MTTSSLKRVGELSFLPGSLRILRPKDSQGKGIKLGVEEMERAYPGVRALMAAPMFGHTGAGGCGAGGLTPCTRQLDRLTGVDYPSCRKKSGITFSVIPRVLKGEDDIGVEMLDQVRDSATLGLQCYPTLVVGSVNKGKRERVSSVAGLGVLPTPEGPGNARFLYLVAAGGTLRDLGDLFLERGCTYAGYCDAGSSAALWVVGEGWRGVHARNPKLPAWLAVVGEKITSS